MSPRPVTVSTLYASVLLGCPGITLLGCVLTFRLLRHIRRTRVGSDPVPFGERSAGGIGGDYLPGSNLLIPSLDCAAGRSRAMASLISSNSVAFCVA